MIEKVPRSYVLGKSLQVHCKKKIGVSSIQLGGVGDERPIALAPSIAFKERL